ncbi:hypothetical protein BH10ACT11_BH10ACT11_07000 [soil metagenome]
MNPATFDHARLECVGLAGAEAKLRGTVRFLQVAGERHEGVERRIELPAISIRSLVEGEGMEFAYEGEERIEGKARLSASQIDMVGENEMQAFKVTLTIENTKAIDADGAASMDRGQALRRSLLSTHLVVEITEGRFVTPLENEGGLGAAVQECMSENIWACLGGKDDEAVLGAPIVLPDHASMAPQSLGNLFDNTEIEEALLLHVQVLSDDERAQIAESDPAVREMIERAEKTTPEEMLKLHGELSETDHFKPGAPESAGGPAAGPVRADLQSGSGSECPAVGTTGALPRGAHAESDLPSLDELPPLGELADACDPLDTIGGPAPIAHAEPNFPEFSELPADPDGSSEPEPGHQNPGEPEVTVDGSTFHKGGKVMLRPGTDRDVYDKMLDGRMATIERIYYDYENAVHIAVTVDGSAEQELFRSTGRYLFFKPHEVEAV